MKQTIMIGALLTAALMSTARSTPLDPIEFSGSLCSNVNGACSTTLSSASTISVGGSNLTFGANPSPSITATIIGPTSTGSGPALPAIGVFKDNTPSSWLRGTGYAGLQYYAEIVGPDGISVPVDLDYMLTLSVTGDEQGSAYIALNPSGHSSPPLKQLTTTGGSSDGRTIGHVTDSTIRGMLTDTVMTNTEFDIGELVRLYGTGTGYANVDPVLYIDPSFASIDPNYFTDFQVVLSPTVGNTEASSVPEPITISLFAAGLVGAGALRRRKKNC